MNEGQSICPCIPIWIREEKKNAEHGMCGECKLPLDSSISTRVTFFILCRNTKYELHMYTRPIHTACVLKRKKDPNGSFIEFKTEDISVADNILVSVQKYCRKLLRVPMYHCAVCQEECPWNSRCGACQRTMYCGYDCQAADWPIHKESCKPINWDPTVPHCPCYTKEFKILYKHPLDTCYVCGRGAYSNYDTTLTICCIMIPLGESSKLTHSTDVAFCSSRCRKKIQEN
jgi:hypothetical protein